MAEVYYRLHESLLYDSKMVVSVTTYTVYKHTPKGVWVTDNAGYLTVLKRFILHSARKRFAYPTMELAIESFIARKESQIWRLKQQLLIANAALKGAMDSEFKVDEPFTDETLSGFSQDF